MEAYCSFREAIERPSCAVIPYIPSTSLNVSVHVGASAWVTREGGQHRTLYFTLKYFTFLLTCQVPADVLVLFFERDSVVHFDCQRRSQMLCTHDKSLPGVGYGVRKIPDRMTPLRFEPTTQRLGGVEAINLAIGVRTHINRELELDQKGRGVFEVGKRGFNKY